MRIGMVCPYSFDVHGGVQAHVLQLAEVMRERGHDVSVLAPSSPDVELPDYVVSGGKAVPIPYNGSVARLRFGPATHRLVKKWIAAGDFDPSDAADFWDLVNKQGWAICESVQRGMSSRSYTHGWFAPMEDDSADIRRWLLPRMGDG